MADRFPLIANPNTSKIQEIPSGDTLDLTGNNVKGVGIITATTFSGNLTGSVTGNASGLTGTPNVVVGTLGCGNVTSTGDVTGVNATFSGNLTVNGTTTTIDTAVTSVDSLAVDGRITGAGITVSGVGDLAVSQSTQGQSATLFLGKGGSSKVFSVDESGNLKIGSNLDSASTTNITLGTTGSAEFDGKVDVNNELHVHRASTTASNALLALHSDIGGTKTRKSTIRADGSAEFSGTVSDSIGPLRRLGIQGASGGFSLAADMAGKLIRSTGNGSTLTIPQNVFSAGDMISVFNVSTGDNTIAQGTGATLYNTADGATGNRTLAAKGVCTIVCTSTNEFIISGSQVS